jgi:CRP/FNR family transcriptional activator FtrB
MTAPVRSPLLDALRLCPLFARLAVDDLRALSCDAVRGTYDAGTILFRQGEPAERFFVVLSGQVALCMGDVDDTMCIARIVGDGGTFAESCVCGIGAYPVTAKVLRSADVTALPRAALCDLLERRSDLLLGMLAEMSYRLRGLVRQIGDLKMKTAAERLAAYILSLAGATGGPAEIRLPIEKKILALQLGMQPETLSRALLKLQPLGVRYRGNGNTLYVRDLAALLSFAAPDEDHAAVVAEG